MPVRSARLPWPSTPRHRSLINADCRSSRLNFLPARLAAHNVWVPFGPAQRSELSDHYGYVVRYALRDTGRDTGRDAVARHPALR